MMNRQFTGTAFRATACGLMLWSATMFAADRIEFVPVPEFPQVPADVTLGKCSAVAVDSRDQVYLFHRGKTPILCFDRDGTFIRGWGNDLIHAPHGIRIDRDDNIWTTDTGHHLVLKFSPAGKLVLALGTSDKPGTGNDQFNKPTDLAFGPSGEVFVSDGYGNNRVMQFDSHGKFVKTWGKAGDRPGEFNLPHAVRVDSHQRILVGDRENKRIQVFDRDGKVLAIWEGFSPYGLEIDRAGTIFVADAVAHKIVQLDSDGKIVHAWGGEGTKPGQFRAPHMLATDSEGSLFVAEVDGMRMQKFVRKVK
jgi:DNA-binding beta-propeller fold protein YncE